MGRDKATVELGGIAMIEHVARACSDASLNVVVVGRDAMPTTVAIERWIADELPGAGPLAALAAVLRATSREVLLVACDMPMLDAASVAWLVGIPMTRDVDALIVRHDDRIEPTFSRYRASCLDAVDAMIARGERSLRALLDVVTVATVDAPPSVARRLVNVNTPEDLDRLDPFAR
jgi:molybdopterin-guanine dinucleotide biosynthesis protein A